MSNNKLSKSINIYSGTAMAISLVMGAGLLVVPGIAYHQVGSATIYAWIINSIIIIPLLIIFSSLATKFPNAGGISGFVKNAYGRNMAASTEVLMLGTFSLALPAVAFTASYYLGDLANLTRQQVYLTSIGVLILAIVINAIGTKVSSTLQQFLAYALVILLIGVSLSVFIMSPLDQGSGVADIKDWHLSIPAVGLVFFAYAGWEILAFTSEEYENPEKDYPKVVLISFLLIVALYLLITLGLQLSISQSNPKLLASPISLLFESALGKYSALVTSICAAIIIIAHLLSAIWGASRLIYSSARDGLLPRYLSLTSSTGNPFNAVLALGMTLIFVAVLIGEGYVTVPTLLTLAGQNFFILSIFAVISYIKIFETLFSRILGLGTLTASVAILFSFGYANSYPIMLISIGYLISYFRNVKSVNSVA